MRTLLEPYQLGPIRLRNRIVKSGIYEGRCDENGFPVQSYVDFYETYARNEAGAIITGFAYVSREGRAMQPFQSGMDHPDKILHYQKVTNVVHQYGCPIFIQLAHSGRQTLKRVTGYTPRGSSSKRSVYFREKPEPLSTDEVYLKIKEFAEAAFYAKESGFDGIQLHAAHGYLIHQFLLPAINTRKDEFGTDSHAGIGFAFLEKIILATREKCGDDFPILVKISGAVDLKPEFTLDQFKELIRFLDAMKVTAIEISYGTMDHALNIFRGDVPESLILLHNPMMSSRNRISKMINQVLLRQYFMKKIKPFTPAYNLGYAAIAKQITRIPVISVGGFRTGDEMQEAIDLARTDLIGLARPFICEPYFVQKFKSNGSYSSQCVNCNFCSVMCDTKNETRCYKH